MIKRPKFKASGLKTGEQVVMHTCRESAKYADKVWTTRSEPWDLCGSEVILLEGFSGGFATEYLRKKEKCSLCNDNGGWFDGSGPFAESIPCPRCTTQKGGK